MSSVKMTSIYIFSRYKDILTIVRQNLKEYFRIAVKQKDMLEMILDFIQNDQSLKTLLNMEIQLPSSGTKIYYTVSARTKEKLNKFIEDFQYVEVQQNAHHYILTSSRTKFEHHFQMEEYIYFLLQIFVHIINGRSEKQLKNIFKVVAENYN